jgi:hypothetical protein
MSFCTLDLKLQLQEKCVPVSRTRTPKKNRNNLAPKSKEAQRKIRRWSFVVEVTVGDTTKTFQPPALTIGNLGSARAAAETIRADIASLDQFKDAKVVVKPRAEETVSLTILNQINGLNEQSRLLIEDEAARQVEFDRHVTERLGKYVMEEQQAMRRQQMIDAGIDPDQVLNNQLPAEQVPAEFQAAPAVEEAPAEQVNTDPFPDGEFGKEAA